MSKIEGKVEKWVIQTYEDPKHSEDNRFAIIEEDEEMPLFQNVLEVDVPYLATLFGTEEGAERVLETIQQEQLDIYQLYTEEKAKHFKVRRLTLQYELE